MNTINANAGGGGYQLKSDLARVCLPVPHAHDQRDYAWTNSICLMFLIIGLVGFRPQPPPPPVVKALEEAAPVVLLAQPPPPPPTDQTQEIKPEEKAEPAQPKVLVTIPSAAVVFSVPTTNGTLVSPKDYVVQSDALPKEATPQPLQQAQPSQVRSTGVGGDRPDPKYPQMAQDLGQQGTVVLLLMADEAGVITSIEVKESSGFPILDHAAAEFVKKHWTVATGARGRLFVAPIKYKLP